jgi:hypothetical protein
MQKDGYFGGAAEWTYISFHRDMIPSMFSEMSRKEKILTEIINTRSLDENPLLATKALRHKEEG